MIYVVSGIVFIKGRHLIAESNSLVEMAERRASQARGEPVMTGEDEDERVKGIHLEIEEHREFEKGF